MTAFSESFRSEVARIARSQKEMARLLHVSALSVYKWETGKVTPRAAQIVRVREVLKMGAREARRQIAQ